MSDQIAVDSSFFYELRCHPVRLVRLWFCPPLHWPAQLGTTRLCIYLFCVGQARSLDKGEPKVPLTDEWTHLAARIVHSNDLILLSWTNVSQLK